MLGSTQKSIISDTIKVFWMVQPKKVTNPTDNASHVIPTVGGIEACEVPYSLEYGIPKETVIVSVGSETKSRKRLLILPLRVG